MARIFITDHVAITSRQRTREGYLVAPGVLSKSGVFNMNNRSSSRLFPLRSSIFLLL
jgi:hypothetical protein